MKLTTSARRFPAAVAIAIATFGVLLLAGDIVVRDQAMIFAGCAALAFSVALSVVVLPAPALDTHDAFENVAWGKLFVAFVYASVGAVCIIAMARTPDASRFAHAVLAAL